MNMNVSNFVIGFLIVQNSTLLLEFKEERLQLSAGGLFNVGRQLIPAV